MYFWIGGMTGFIIAVIAFRNVNDTYYAVKIYGVPEKEKTVEFLYSSLKPQQAVVAISLVFEKYKLLEGKFAVGLGGSEEFGTATPLEATYWVLRAFKATDYKVSSEERRRIKDFIESFRKGDGYGVTQATTTMTYQAIFSLNALEYPVPKTGHFHKCEVCGGFTEVPYSLPPYLEPTFYALRGLKLLGKRPRYVRDHIQFIRALQNPNGGFRRSLEMGISNSQ
ncbi:hypothetical protein [Thermococcus sp. 2319x1]|uniref:prenyltransferase/squalene oxidase repeat-containing protein n=1 Tax=Thermococcus sp. 2319x1 TaxID=1674923 RepID=UPI001E5735E1|nr:hypothetical protein [Thermococcus sp. 2319x1]